MPVVKRSNILHRMATGNSKELSRQLRVMHYKLSKNNAKTEETLSELKHADDELSGDEQRVQIQTVLSKPKTAEFENRAVAQTHNLKVMITEESDNL